MSAGIEIASVQRLPESASHNCRLVLPIRAIVEDLRHFAPCPQHQKIFFSGNLPVINHSQENLISPP